MQLVTMVLHSLCVNVLRLLLGIVFSIVLLLSVPIFVYRFFISKLALLFRCDLGKMLDAQSSLFATPHLDSEPEFNVNIQFKMKGKLDFEKMVQIIMCKCLQKKKSGRSGVAEYPEFEQYFTHWMGYAFWKKEPSFDIYEHMNSVTLQHEADVAPFVQKILERPFPISKSPWQFTFIETRENLNSYTMCFNYHHSLGDGWALYTALTEAADSPVQNFIPKKTPGSPCIGFLRSWNLFLSYFRVLHKMMRQNSSSDGTWDVGRLVGVRLSTLSDPIPLTQIKVLSLKYRVSVSAILIALVTGAIRRKMLLEKTDIPEGGLGCMVPISVPNHPKRLTNKVLFMNVKLPVGLGDISERANAVERRIQRERLTRSSAISYLLSVFAGSFPKFLPIPPPKLSAVAMSVYPGPTSGVSFNGNLVDDMTYAINGNKIHSLLVNLMSYNGQFRFSVSADAAICPNQEEMDNFIYYLHDELHEFERGVPSFKKSIIDIV